MLINAALWQILAAGLMNGSFVVPARYVKKFINEKIWLYHSLIGLGVVPWLMLLITMPGQIQNYTSLTFPIFILLIIGGAIFGLGQVCFAYAIESIGIGLSFTINLGIGVTIGSMFVVFYHNSFFNIQGYITTLAVAFILCSLIIYYFSGRAINNKVDAVLKHARNYHVGWGLAIFAGIASGLQNIFFVLIAFHSHTSFQNADSFWVWPPFLLAAAVPMFINFFYKTFQHGDEKVFLNNSSLSLYLKNIVLITIMGAFFTGSLALYSEAMSKLNSQQQMIGWPVFMVSIILTSQGWGCLQGELKGASFRINSLRIISIILLFVAIIMLAIKF